MADHHETHVPGAALLAAAALIMFSIGIAVAARQGLISGDAPIVADAVQERALLFKDRRQGGIEVVAADTGRVLAVFEPGTNGFARGVMRGLARDRRARGFGPEQPFRLVRFDDGRLTLIDSTTGRTIELVSFGPTNAGVFARLLSADEGES